MNISLTPEQSEYVPRTVEREFGNASEYFRELIRERMRREIAADLALLKSTTQGAPAGPDEAQIEAILKTQRAVRKGSRREGRL